MAAPNPAGGPAPAVLWTAGGAPLSPESPSVERARQLLASSDPVGGPPPDWLGWPTVVHRNSEPGSVPTVTAVQPGSRIGDIASYAASDPAVQMLKRKEREE